MSVQQQHPNLIPMAQPPSITLALPPSPPSLPFPESWLHTRYFHLSPLVYTISMSYQCPLIASILYFIITSTVSEVNKRRTLKPWALSRTAIFRRALVLHNVCLAVFSAWACLSTYNVLLEVWPSRQDTLYQTRLADLLCLGDHFPPADERPQLSAHDIYQPNVLFIGWTFYLSKLYEVLDSAILLAKGRRVSALHKYHHAGVIVCAWMAVRYASPPAIVALLFNSAVHTVMYTYYTLTALRVPPPLFTKAALTSLQIAQFLIGVIIGGSFVFLQYQVSAPPVPYSTQPQGAIAASVLKSATMTATGRDQMGAVWRNVRCVKTSEEAYPIWIGVSFVLFLLFMFVRFFVRAYLGPGLGTKKSL
ncbi:ELO family [Aspergillus bertholletiae]|uniref:Elongation of fatty acids protein n=1 Tax=Aspergillus bertholletiae TaxID=1226010 RepID=A0A5N7BF94_9EURO|nr:ELO family [Aspergillus bertholletiae]